MRIRGQTVLMDEDNRHVFLFPMFHPSVLFLQTKPDTYIHTRIVLIHVAYIWMCEADEDNQTELCADRTVSAYKILISNAVKTTASTALKVH